MLGSLNWNRDAATENRELVLELARSTAAEYYGRAFQADWRGGGGRFPAGIALSVAVAAGIALAVARREIQFGG